MPVAILSFGAAGSLLIGAAISLVGLVATFLLAPETANKSLAELTTDKRPAAPATITEGTLV
jgi:putative MFS transporter